MKSTPSTKSELITTVRVVARETPSGVKVHAVLHLRPEGAVIRAD